jgi:hypothetical protein
MSCAAGTIRTRACNRVRLANGSFTMKRPTALMLIGIVLIGLAPFSTLGAYGLNSWCFCFKTAEDGHKLVYPWGALGFVVGAPAGGYVITSEQQYKLLRRYLKANAVVWLVLVGITSWIQIYLRAHPDVPDPPLPIAIVIWCFIVFVVWCFIAFDISWRRYLVRGMPQSDERLSRKDKALVAGRAGLLLLFSVGIAALLVIHQVAELVPTAHP